MYRFGGQFTRRARREYAVGLIMRRTVKGSRSRRSGCGVVVEDAFGQFMHAYVRLELSH